MDAAQVPANSILFSELCQVFNKLHKSKKQKPHQQRILSEFVNEFRINVSKIPGRKNATFFPILRLLLPDKERQRCAYNLKEKKLGELIVSVALNKQSKEAKRILEFRSASKNSDSDLPGVAFFVLQNRYEQKQGNFTVGDINNLLDEIANAEVGNKKEIQERVLSKVFRNTNAENAKWFLRLILKDLKLEMGLTRILSVFHPDAPEMYEKCGNLVKVCEDLEDGNIRPLELGIQIFYAISPMLSERFDVTYIANRLPQNKTYQIEEKFDGERFQMHMENQKFEYFSRRGFTYSDNYGKTTDTGSLTPQLKNCFQPSVVSFILDGEMMGWHKEYQYFSSKGLSFDVKKITPNSKFQPCFCVFDVLYYNGISLIGPPEKGGRPLKERLQILDSMFIDVPGVIMHSKRQLVKETSDILEALNKAIEDQSEGIVVKDVESYYIPNKRNAGWYKIKPEYTESTMTDLDLVIIGADEAENKKQGRAKSFFVACSDAEQGDRPNRWVSVGRVATGLTFEQRESVCKLLETNWVNSKKKQPPTTLYFNKDKPDFWIEPQHSVAVTVRATELIRSSNFGTAYTFRFPRIVDIRYDKPPTDVMTLHELNQLITDKGPVVKLGTKRVNSDQMDSGGSTEVQVRKKRTIKPVLVAEQFLTPTSTDVQVVSKALLGRKVCILNTDEACKKDELSRIIQSHGGKIVANNGPDVWCCVAAKITPRIKVIIDSKEADVVTPSWIMSIANSDDLVELVPLDMLGMRKATRLALGDRYDKYGLSYTDEVDEATLKKCFQKMEREEPETFLTKKEMLALDQELFGDDNPFSYLRPCNMYLDIDDDLLKIKARIYKATICPITYKKLTHVVTNNTSKVEGYREIMENKQALIVSKDWLVKCCEESKKVLEDEFLIN